MDSARSLLRSAASVVARAISWLLTMVRRNRTQQEQQRLASLGLCLHHRQYYSGKDDHAD
jgi:hypothetical protein